MYTDKSTRWKLGLCVSCPQPIVPGHVSCEKHLNRRYLGVRPHHPHHPHWTPMDALVLGWCAYYRCPWPRLVALFPERTETAIRKRLNHLLARRPPPEQGRQRRPKIQLKKKTRIPASPATS
jgi:hypothetical protein